MIHLREDPEPTRQLSMVSLCRGLLTSVQTTSETDITETSHAAIFAHQRLSYLLLRIAHVRHIDWTSMVTGDSGNLRLR